MPGTSLKGYYIEARKDLREAEPFILLAAVIFLAGAVLGSYLPERFEILLDPLKQIAERLKGQSLPVLVIIIFLQNSTSALISILFGILFGIMPVIGAVTNGILMGLVLSIEREMGMTGLFLRVIPHGIFELPAMFMSWGLGMWLGTWLLRRDKQEALRERIRRAFRVFFAIVLPLLIIAAGIEGLVISFGR